ncbi:MAG TPA: hypothetical protein DDZ80_12600 [Cyanobacteria bacterium UBA8803]|nr:hypothetical protein [Cyanobacteria bacterium UBA9273]HBL59317.1 hypothetical protein [Cyanobacteria bacterium UBA8803]
MKLDETLDGWLETAISLLRLQPESWFLNPPDGSRCSYKQLLIRDAILFVKKSGLLTGKHEITITS